MSYGDSMMAAQAIGDDRAVAGLRVGLDAEQRGRAVARKLRPESTQVDVVEDLPHVPLPIGRRQLAARALAHALARVLGVLQLPQLGRRGQLGVVAVADSGLG